MLEKFLGLKIKGRCFAEETELKFFPSDKQRVSMVFGRNGSGKSTVSRTFARIAKDAGKHDGMDIVEPITRPSDKPTETSEALERKDIQPMIRVFNENYVRDKLRFENGDAEGLSTIVLLDKQKDLDTTIQQKTAEKDQLVEDQKKCTKLKEELENAESPQSPAALKEKVILRMKSDPGWARRDADIRGNKRASTPHDEDIPRVMACTGEDSAGISQPAFDGKLAERNALAKNLNVFVPPINIGSSLDFDEAALLKVLNEIVKEPELNERDKRVIEVMREFHNDWITHVEEHLRKAETTYCPYCLRTFEAGDKDKVFASIKAALSKDVDDYKMRLQKVAIPVLPALDLAAYKEIAPEAADKAIELYQRLNEILQQYKADRDQRLNQVYALPDYHIREFTTTRDAFLQQVRVLEDKRDELKNAQQRIDALNRELTELNLKLTKREIKGFHATYEAQCKAQKENLEKIASLDHSIGDLKKVISDLEAQKRSVHIAAKRINAALAYIFMSKKRLELVPDNGLYRIETNGHAVAPIDISVGERNALAMCYFFSDILEGYEEEKAYAKEWLVVLDDPVSSFDRENKMGVLSYIMFEIENLTAAQANTRIICLMHELHAYFALAGFIHSYNSYYRGDKDELIPMAVLSLDYREKELINLLEERSKNPNEKPKQKHLDDINEYCMNFKEIFDYACLDNPKDNIHVGNQARRILEAFSTFVYRKGFEHLFLGRLVTGDLATKYNSYFHDVFSRFAVNDESHLHGHVRSLADANNLYPFLSDIDRQRAVRDSICLLYLILRDHVRSLLDKDADERKKQEKIIQSWLVDIQNSMLTTEEEGTAA